jgi:hypothetical protein
MNNWEPLLFVLVCVPVGIYAVWYIAGRIKERHFPG